MSADIPSAQPAVAAAATQPATATTTPSDHEAAQQSLREAICAQIAHYLSPANLATDTFLSNRMTPQDTVPLSLLMTFPRLREICSDRETIISALVLSKSFHVDHDTAHGEVFVGVVGSPSVSCSLTLKDVPVEFGAPELQALTYQPIVRASRNKTVSSSWVVTFENDMACQLAMKEVRMSAKVRALPIRCYFKTDFYGHVPFDATATPYVPKHSTAANSAVAGAPIRAVPVYYPSSHHMMMGGCTTILPSMAQMLAPSSGVAGAPLSSAFAGAPYHSPATTASEGANGAASQNVQGAAIRRMGSAGGAMSGRGGAAATSGRRGGRGGRAVDGAPNHAPEGDHGTAKPVAPPSPPLNPPAPSDQGAEAHGSTVAAAPAATSSAKPWAAALLKGIENRAVAQQA